VVHGPILIAFSELNGYEYGTRERNIYRSLVNRKPDEVIASGIAVFHGDFPIPAAASMAHISRSSTNLKRDPKLALTAAKAAVALVPDGLDENLALADARAASEDKAGARAALHVAAAKVSRMEPEAQNFWRHEIEKKLAQLRP
jgi:6-phosphofructokinase